MVFFVSKKQKKQENQQNTHANGSAELSRAIVLAETIEVRAKGESDLSVVETGSMLRVFLAVYNPVRQAVW
ncbi:hypothetical protein DAMNIGENAA_33130 [Desulforhabdus amnigena]|uniref:Uncharacterized protein n=1 Tax=Desulforhabdus amnigena TaxID=40218 RepID=A0A9W6LA90_9BACT|nr:hypothetical protein DAMNIGENAA_33130 [Desulforhabdus amnigena]